MLLASTKFFIAALFIAAFILQPNRPSSRRNNHEVHAGDKSSVTRTTPVKLAALNLLAAEHAIYRDS